MKDLQVVVKSNKQIASGVYEMVFTLPEAVGEIHGGQFLNLSTGNGAHLLRRPLGICKADGRDITVCYQIKGSGTQKLSAAEEGDELKALLPLGNGFDLSGYKNIAVIGGGVGVFPLIATIREYAREKNFYVYAGFRNKASACLLNDLGKGKKLVITTDDGSLGNKGNAVEAFFDDRENIPADAIIACGPPVMLRALKERLSQLSDKTPCYVSLEERMGCGLGACLVCTCKTTFGNKRVCKDGPVFNIEEVEL